MKIIKLKNILYYFIIGNILKCKFRCLSEEETLIYIKKKKISFLRWGDGETALLRGKSISFQKASSELSVDLYKILLLSSEGVFLLGIPCRFFNQKFKNILRIDFWRNVYVWASTHYQLSNNLKINQLVGDAFLFRPPGTISINRLANLWDGLNIILLSPSILDIEIINRISVPLSIKHILCSKRNSYEQADLYIENIKKHLLFLNINKTVIILSAGPGGKIIGLKLSQQGYYCLDVGNFFNLKILEDEFLNYN
jgi:hypothetical protein